MKKRYELGQMQFDALLNLFSDDRSEAGEKYEQIRNGLTRFFEFRGCHDPETLVDETINRVAGKIDSFDGTRNIKPAAFFYGFATNVLSEYRRDSRREIALDETPYEVVAVEDDGEVEDARIDCLHKCMAKLDAVEKELITSYFAHNGREKIELRRKMSERLNCSPAALHTRVFRIKASLKVCIANCTKSKL